MKTSQMCIATHFSKFVLSHIQGGMTIDAILGSGSNSSGGSSGADSSSPDSATAANKTTLSNKWV